MSVSAKVKEHMEVRVGVFGTSGVGKSCLIHRFITGQFKTESDPTVGGKYIYTVILNQKQSGTK